MTTNLETEELQALADAWMAKEYHAEHRGKGWLMIGGGVVDGWCLELPPAEDWIPGVLAWPVNGGSVLVNIAPIKASRWAELKGAKWPLEHKRKPLGIIEQAISPAANAGHGATETP